MAWFVRVSGNNTGLMQTVVQIPLGAMKIGRLFVLSFVCFRIREKKYFIWRIECCPLIKKSKCIYSFDIKQIKGISISSFCVYIVIVTKYKSKLPDQTQHYLKCINGVSNFFQTNYLV